MDFLCHLQIFGAHFGRFLETPGIVVVFEGAGKCSEKLWFWGSVLGDPGLREPPGGKVKTLSLRDNSNQFASIHDRSKECYTLRGCRNEGLHGLQGYRATRLGGLQDYSLQKYASSLVAPSGRRMTGSALKRWTLWWHCFSERI